MVRALTLAAGIAMIAIPADRMFAAASTPYSGTPAAIPGQINAELFDNGGEGVAYYDTTPGNSGGQARATDVDIETSSEGGYDVGWIAAGEWLNYTVTAQSAGGYSVQLRVASPGGASMHVGFNGPSSVWSVVAIPATGGWQNWTTVTLPVTLGAGTQLMTLQFDTGRMNLEYTNVTSTSSSTGSSPYSGTPLVLPGTIEAENFDNGGEGVAYHDTTPGNSGGAYRGTDVDIEACSEGGYDVGWIAAGEWLNYTVNVSSAGSYTVGLRVASPNGATLHVGFDTASNVWTSVSIPSTGGWQNWTTVNVPVTLGAGVQQMTLMFDTSGVNVNYVNVAASSGGPASPSAAVRRRRSDRRDLEHRGRRLVVVARPDGDRLPGGAEPAAAGDRHRGSTPVPVQHLHQRAAEPDRPLMERGISNPLPAWRMERKLVHELGGRGRRRVHVFARPRLERDLPALCRLVALGPRGGAAGGQRQR
jgi:hypothetical protein